MVAGPGALPAGAAAQEGRAGAWGRWAEPQPQPQAAVRGRGRGREGARPAELPPEGRWSRLRGDPARGVRA